MTAAAVKVFVIEAIRYKPFGVARRLAATSANPIPLDQTSSPSCTTPTAAPARRCSLTNLAAIAAYFSAGLAAGLGTRRRYHLCAVLVCLVVVLVEPVTDRVP